MRCRQLGEDYRCRLHGTAGMPRVCAGLAPSPEMCGSGRTEALAYLAGLEAATAPGP